jgi:DNA-binding MarR family transcriptional regulator
MNRGESLYFDDFGSKITVISHAIRQAFNKLYQEYNLTFPQARVLTYLMDNQDRDCINQRELERALGLKASSVSSLVVTLEQKGFITCQRIESDARNKRILLTDQARELQSVTDAAAQKIESTLGSGIEGEEREIVDRALEKMVHNLLDMD